LELSSHTKGTRPPAWVPKNLRDGLLSAELTEILSKGDIPKVHGGRHMELYTAMVDETAKRAGIKADGILPAIDGSGAIVQSMRQNTAHRAAPKVASEPGVSVREVSPTKDELNQMFKDDPGVFDFQAYRKKQGRIERMKMGQADSKTMDWVDDSNITFEKDVSTTRANNETVVG